MRSTSSLVTGMKLGGVDPYRGHPCQAVVRQHKQGAGEYIVETAHHHTAIRYPRLCKVHRRQVLNMVDDVQHRIVADFAVLDHGYRGRGLQNLFPPAGGGDHALLKNNDLLHQDRIQPGGLSGPHLHIFTYFGLIADKRDFDPVVPRWNGDAEPPLCARCGPGALRQGRSLNSDVGAEQGLPPLSCNRPLDKAS